MNTAVERLTPGVALRLNRRVPKRYRQHLHNLPADGTPFGFLVGPRSDPECLLLVIPGPSAERAIGVHISLSESGVCSEQDELLRLAVQQCRHCGVDELTLRFRVDHPARKQLFDTVEREGWPDPETVHSYYRKELSGVLKEVAWLRRLDRDGIGLPSGYSLQRWSDLNPERLDALHEEHEQNDLWDNDVGPTADCDADLSFALSCEDRLIGWMQLSRRRRGLLYNRLFLRTEFRSAGLGAKLAARAIIEHCRREPSTAAFAHLNDSRRDMVTFYDRHLKPFCDRYEQNWVTQLII